MNNFNEIEELEAFERRLEYARLRRRQLEEQRRQLENEYTTYDTPEKLKGLAEIAEKATESSTFKQQFCHFYHQRVTRTTADIVEGVIGITFGSNIPLAIVALIIIKLLRMLLENHLDDYCAQCGETKPESE
jgi:hypothetical protein